MSGGTGGLAGVGGALLGRPADPPGETVMGGVGKALAQLLEELPGRLGGRRRGQVGEESRAQLPDLRFGAADRDPVALGQEATPTAGAAIPARVRS